MVGHNQASSDDVIYGNTCNIHIGAEQKIKCAM
jgi:hypothetical protein